MTTVLTVTLRYVAKFFCGCSSFNDAVRCCGLTHTFGMFYDFCYYIDSTLPHRFYITTVFADVTFCGMPWSYTWIMNCLYRNVYVVPNNTNKLIDPVSMLAI